MLLISWSTGQSVKIEKIFINKNGAYPTKKSCTNLENIFH